MLRLLKITLLARANAAHRRSFEDLLERAEITNLRFHDLRHTAARAPSGASKPASGPAPEKRYTVTFSVNIQNLLNTTNLAQPIGNLSSPQLVNRSPPRE